MKFISIIGLLQDLDEVVKICGKSEVFHPDDVFSFYANTERFTQLNEENPYTKSINKILNVIRIAEDEEKIVDISDFDADSMQIEEYVEHISSKMIEMDKEKRELSLEIKNCKNEIGKIEKFKGLNSKIVDLLDCEYVKVRFGRLPRENYEKLSFYSEEDDVMFFPCTDDSTYYWGIYFAPIDKIEEVDRIFSGLYFETISIEPFDGTVESRIKDLETKCDNLETKISETNKKMKSFWEQQKGQCLRVYSKLKELEAFYSIRKFAAKYNESFILVGWIPAENEREFCVRLSEINGVEYSTEDGKNILNHSPPVKLKNKKLFKPFEFFVSMYGLPSYDEIDPTIFVSITYTVLFGIMFADLGHGIVLSIVGYLMWKLKKMPLGKPLIGCGFFSALFGVVFGSVFGYENALDPFYKAVFGLKEKPIDVMNGKSSGIIIYSAVGIGVGLLMIAMILNIYSSIKRHRYGLALFGQNGLAGLVFYGSSVLFLVDYLVIKSGIATKANIVIFTVIPILLIMFSEILSKIVEKEKQWKPKNWNEYFMQSFFETFEAVLNYLTNTMSFLRVGAFVLVHAGMMMVVFTIANLLNGVGYVFAVVVGNIFVICLEAVLTGIQVLRLEFYELFGRFLEGQGRAFTPVTVENELNI